MGSRRRRTGERSSQPWIAGVIALVVTSGFVAAIAWRSSRIDGQSGTSSQSARSAATPVATPSPAEWALPDDLPPLPLPKEPLPRPTYVVRAAYEAAARHPEVLGQIPCFCGCSRLGHRSNHDCFVSTRGPNVSLAWDAHGMG
jgi:hypothetical protein